LEEKEYVEVHEERRRERRTKRRRRTCVQFWRFVET